MKDDAEFMNELEAATQLKAVTSANVFLFAITGLVIFFVLWAQFSQVEELTRAQGQVVPSQETQYVQSLEGGIVQEILIAEGDHVAKGQILMRISDVEFLSEERGVEAKSASLRAKRARLSAEASGVQFQMPEDITKAAPKIAQTELALYESRRKERENALSIINDKVRKVNADIAQTRADISRLSDTKTSLSEELEITKRLVQQKAVSKLEQIRLERDFRDVSGQIEVAKKRLNGLYAEANSAKRELKDIDDRFRSQALGELNEVETQIAQISESLKSIGDRVDRTELRSPVDGIVNRIAVKTIGGVVTPAQELVEIVPIDDQLKIIAKVQPNDIAFLRPGQGVNVKITAYDSTRYGAINGRLVRIGANSVTDERGNIFFEVEVRTKKNHMGSEENPLPITPGMVANVEVITGKRTIMEYMLKPLLRAKSVALTER